MKHIRLNNDASMVRAMAFRRTTGTMMKGIIRSIAAPALLTLIAVAFGACAGGEASEPEPTAERVGRIVSVEVREVVPEEFIDVIQIVGRVEANRDVVVSAEEGGTIRELLVEKGAYVRAGQPIARIDDRILRSQAEQAAAEATLARETWERQRRLWEDDRVGSEMTYLQARYRDDTASAGAKVLNERLERTVVRAPIDGILDDRMVEIGTLVSPGTPVARIIDMSTVKVTGGVPERYAGQIERGTPAEVLLEVASSSPFSGNVDFVGASVDQGNRTFPVEIAVPNPAGVLKPGMIANARLTRETVSEALVVPQEAVMRVEDGYAVYVASDDGDEPMARVRPVTLGPTQANRVIITSGLEAGDRVVVVGQNRIANGDRLQIVHATAGRTQ